MEDSLSGETVAADTLINCFGPTLYKVPMCSLSLLILEQASVKLTHYKRELVQGHSWELVKSGLESRPNLSASHPIHCESLLLRPLQVLGVKAWLATFMQNLSKLLICVSVSSPLSVNDSTYL